MMTMQRRLTGLLQLLMSAALALSGGARAQGTDLDPPGRVARLSELNGPVWLYSPDSAEWRSATLNLPMTTGDRVATDAGARAELQIGSTTVRVDAGSELEIVQLDDDHVTLALHDGSVIARVRDLTDAGRLELGTDEGRFVTLRAGTYRFDRNDGKSALTVYSGQARYEGPNSGLSVNAGQRAEFWIDSGGVAQYSTLSPVSDAFAAWSNDRDRRVAGSIAERYVSPEMTGAADLDVYGRWEQTPDYGSVWFPTAVAADWAPYSHGHWTWVRPWGWTWVDDAPWGFAPFHYGRWVRVRNNWCWTPGTRVARPVYAPALVAWIGGPRANVSITVGGGPAVGWFPLAPREVFVPSYRVSPRYARNVNITNVNNVTVINNVFANPHEPREFENRRFPRAITVVPANVMTQQRPVAPAAAQYRQTPGVRDVTHDRGRTIATLAPSVATPPMPARDADPRGVRPPPLAAPSQGREPVRGEFGPGQRAPGSFSQQPPSPGLAQPPRPPAANSPTRLPFGQPQQPAAQPVRPAAASPAPQEAPMMRALPVRRGDERRDGDRADRRPDERRSQPRPEMPQQPQRVERPAPPLVPRPVEIMRPAAPAAMPAPPPAPRAAPPQPESVRPQRPDSRGDEPKRGEREPR